MTQQRTNGLKTYFALGRQDISSILDRLSGVSVAVIGDFCLDIYWALDRSASEISVETGVLGSDPFGQELRRLLKAPPGKLYRPGIAARRLGNANLYQAVCRQSGIEPH
jgi:hypothetical protein